MLGERKCARTGLDPHKARIAQVNWMPVISAHRIVWTMVSEAAESRRVPMRKRGRACCSPSAKESEKTTRLC